jgi:hypothetical protein
MLYDAKRSEKIPNEIKRNDAKIYKMELFSFREKTKKTEDANRRTLVPSLGMKKNWNPLSSIREDIREKVLTFMRLLWKKTYSWHGRSSEYTTYTALLVKIRGRATVK